MIKIIEQSEEIIDFVWELSQDDLYASYPKQVSPNELRITIDKAISTENQNIIASYHQNELVGVCIYLWKCDEQHAQTIVFLIKDDYDQVADELIGYIKKQLPSYELLIGVPFTNNNANQYFLSRNIKCIESSIDTRLYDLKPQIRKEHNQVERIMVDDFQDYEIFHDKHAIPLEMYYTSKNLKKNIERFRVFAYKQEGVIQGSIFAFVVKDFAEVFGLFVDKEYKNKGIEEILINEMLMQIYGEFGSIKEFVYFIDEDSTEELKAALDAGFEVKDRYRCYKCLL